jgi:hypothetical protein
MTESINRKIKILLTVLKLMQFWKRQDGILPRRFHKKIGSHSNLVRFERLLSDVDHWVLSKCFNFMMFMKAFMAFRICCFIFYYITLCLIILHLILLCVLENMATFYCLEVKDFSFHQKLRALIKYLALKISQLSFE